MPMAWRGSSCRQGIPWCESAHRPHCRSCIRPHSQHKAATMACQRPPTHSACSTLLGPCEVNRYVASHTCEQSRAKGWPIGCCLNHSTTWGRANACVQRAQWPVMPAFDPLSVCRPLVKHKFQLWRQLNATTHLAQLLVATNVPIWIVTFSIDELYLDQAQGDWQARVWCGQHNRQRD